ncbi:[protein-PII] uridylyltransferase [Parvularcula oceani]|uniref:[protein-PII] uridylyltransferase n=1 Tax=Parvularcula oceani TaxID=1247963 RepID=UPI0004E18435|nr:[protein-PII] uridylyltransferase [Parvularcula oceani]
MSETAVPLSEAMAEAAATGRAGALIAEHFERTRKSLFAKTRRGSVIAEGLCAAVDEALCLLLQETRQGAEVCLVATGGYGRGRLAPHSDIDLLILTGRGGDEAAQRILYPLWDSGLPLSQAVHDPQSAARAAAEDLTCRTAFLDGRFLCGEAGLFAEFRSRFERLRGRSVPEFIEAKLAERDERHARTGASRYEIEPDVKEGKGGMRDLDLLHWLDRYAQGAEAAPVQEMTTPGLFTETEARRLSRVQDFLWSIRVHLHDLHGRADDRLSFPVQPALAERLGYKGRRSAPAVERLMKHYFLNAREVGRLTGSACAMLEEKALKSTMSRRFAEAASRLTQERGFGGMPNLVRRGERLTFADPDSVTVRDLFSLFLVSGRQDIRLHPSTLQTAVRVARRVGRAERIDPGLADIFKAIIRDSGDLERVLRRMTECGLLGRYLPAYGAIIGKAEYGLFRRYTLDEHVLRSIGIFAALRAGRDDGSFPLTQPLARELDPVPVVLALLLQETIAGLPRRSESRLRRRVGGQAKRLLGAEEAADVVFLVTQRDLLARTAARRNVTESFVVGGVAGVVGTRERLDQLSVMTACRHRTAGVGSWQAYNNRDVRLLVEECRAYLAGGESGFLAFLAERSEALRAEAREGMEDLDEQAQDAFFARTRPDFWSMASPGAAARLAALVTAADREGEHHAACVTPQPDGTVEVIVYAEDRPGLFADLSGLVAEAGGTVWGAAAFPLRAPGGGTDRAVTILEVMRPGTPPEPMRVEQDEADRLARRFKALAAKQAPEPQLPPPGIADRRKVFDVEPVVRVFADVSPDDLIVEAEGLDRPGLLFLLATALEEIGVTIRLAYVATYGERAVDTFYLQDAPGRGIDDPRRIEAIRRQLTRVLTED